MAKFQVGDIVESMPGVAHTSSYCGTILRVGAEDYTVCWGNLVERDFTFRYFEGRYQIKYSDDTIKPAMADPEEYAMLAAAGQSING